MELSIAPTQLCDYINKQLEHFFPDGTSHDSGINQVINAALERLEFCFSHICKKYYQATDSKGNVTTLFNHLNSDHYASLVYLLSNEAYMKSDVVLAEKLFYLNKSLNGLDCFYSIKLPDVFMFVHPVGTVLGNANYQDFLVIYQGVTVGSSLEGKYPNFGKGAVMYANTSIIGQCTLGNNVVFGAGASLINSNVEPKSSVLGMAPNQRIITTNIDVIKDVFGFDSRKRK